MKTSGKAERGRCGCRRGREGNCSEGEAAPGVNTGKARQGKARQRAQSSRESDARTQPARPAVSMTSPAAAAAAVGSSSSSSGSSACAARVQPAALQSATRPSQRGRARHRGTCVCVCVCGDDNDKGKGFLLRVVSFFFLSPSCFARSPRCALARRLFRGSAACARNARWPLAPAALLSLAGRGPLPWRSLSGGPLVLFSLRCSARSACLPSASSARPRAYLACRERRVQGGVGRVRARKQRRQRRQSGAAEERNFRFFAWLLTGTSLQLPWNFPASLPRPSPREGRRRRPLAQRGAAAAAARFPRACPGCPSAAAREAAL